MCWPSPLRARCSRAARIAATAVIAASGSGKVAPELRGGPPGKPSSEDIPEAGSIVPPFEGRSRYGPLAPKPLIEQRMMSGRSSRIAS